MTRRMARGVGVVALALAPVLAGVIASTVWQQAGEDRWLTIQFLLAWLPAWVGGLITAVLLPLTVAWLILRTRTSREKERALQSERDRHRRFLARLDHEMKNPIQGIRLAIADGPSEQQQLSIDMQTNQLARLLSDLRRLSEAELVRLEESALDPSALISEAVDAARELPGAESREWHVSIPRAPRPLPPIRGDADLLYFALANVLSNAVKFSSRGDRIEVRASETSEGLAIEVADTGMGIPDEEQETVWEELGRGREARGLEGSGLGLPFVRAIIERHGGNVELRSIHGEGTAIVLQLPTE